MTKDDQIAALEAGLPEMRRQRDDLRIQRDRVVNDRQNERDKMRATRAKSREERRRMTNTFNRLGVPFGEFAARCDLLEKQVDDRNTEDLSRNLALGFDVADPGSAVLVSHTIDPRHYIIVAAFDVVAEISPDLPFKVWCRYCDEEFSHVPWADHRCMSRPPGHGESFTTDEAQRRRGAKDPYLWKGPR